MAYHEKGGEYKKPMSQGHHGQAYHHAQSSLGMVGGVASHMLKTMLGLAPVVIMELVPSPEKQRKAIRLVGIGGTIIAEGLWAHHVMKDKRALKECRQDADMRDMLNTYGGTGGIGL